MEPPQRLCDYGSDEVERTPSVGRGAERGGARSCLKRGGSRVLDEDASSYQHLFGMGCVLESDASSYQHLFGTRRLSDEGE